ncbi:MAG: hypothetical protein WBN23_03160 [Woeseia sp.]
MNVRQILIYCRESRVVRVAAFYLPAAWVVLRVVLIAQAGLDAPTWVPKLLAVLLVVGYPVALVVSWAMDIGDDEKEAADTSRTRLTLPVGHRRSKHHETSPLLFGAILVSGTTVLAAALFFMMKIPVAGQPSLPEPEANFSAVAVLPFLNLTTDADQQVFCDGLSEELLNLLTKVESLQVAARTSSFSMRDTELDVPQIGEQLKVSHIVEGSVRRDGDQIRVTAQLVRTSDGYHVWSENYDRKFTRIFEIQDDIAANIVMRLVSSFNSKGAMDSIPKVQRTDPEAYFSYLKGRGALVTRSSEGLSLAASYFDDALAMSPTYQPARIGAVYSAALLGLVNGEDLLQRRELFVQALQLFEEAPADAWSAAAAATLGLSLYEWHRVREVLEFGIGANQSDANLSLLYADFSLSVNEVDAAAYELSRLRKLAPEVTYSSYLESLVNYESSIENLKQLYVEAGWASAWYVEQLPVSAATGRKEAFDLCLQRMTAAGDEAHHDGSCKLLGSFVVPLLLHHGRVDDALQVLLESVERYEFDAKLAHLPELRAVWLNPQAADVRNLLQLPRVAIPADASL